MAGSTIGPRPLYMYPAGSQEQKDAYERRRFGHATSELPVLKPVNPLAVRPVTLREVGDTASDLITGATGTVGMPNRYPVLSFIWDVATGRVKPW